MPLTVFSSKYVTEKGAVPPPPAKQQHQSVDTDDDARLATFLRATRNVAKAEKSHSFMVSLIASECIRLDPHYLENAGVSWSSELRDLAVRHGWIHVSKTDSTVTATLTQS